MNIAFVFILVLANAFFVASEFALVSVRKTRMDQLAAEGNRTAAVVQRAVHNLDRYIAATQVGITLASLLLGGLGERTLEPLLAFLFSWVPDQWWMITRTGLSGCALRTFCHRAAPILASGVRVSLEKESGPSTAGSERVRGS